MDDICYDSERHPERRKYPRAALQIPLQIMVASAGEQRMLHTTSINICMNGIYCSVDRYLPLFDRLLMTFVLPAHDGKPAHVLSQIEGTVVRIDPEQPEPDRNTYYVAIYFQQLSQQQYEALEALLDSHAAIC